jgi:LmbE family N-acetylglucosaminyl deacetylase
MKILVIAPHPDDEVLGMGGTIKKLSKKNKIILCVVSEGATAQYKDKKMIKVRRDSCKKTAKILGISQTIFLDYPDMRLNLSHLDINKKLEEIVEKYRPEIVYTAPKNDLNLDHQMVFNSTLVACRPKSGVKQILCYEIQGNTKVPFVPNVFENIEKEFPYKIKGFKMYKSEIEEFPNPRSIAAIENLAIQRGIESGTRKAEAFELIRVVNQ